MKHTLGNHHIGDITPEVAKDLLENWNTRNRKLNRGKVRKYVKEMLEGTFDTTRLFEGRLFYVDEDGILVSAQHRLAAAVEAGFTFKNAMTVVVDRELFNDKSVEARTPREIAQMNLKVVSQDINPQISDVIHAVTGQKTFLEIPKPFVSKRTMGYENEELIEVYNKIGTEIEILFMEVPKVSKVAANALGCLLYAGKVDIDRALQLATNDYIKPVSGNGVLPWTHAFTDFMNEVETIPGTEKVFLGR